MDTQDRLLAAALAGGGVAVVAVALQLILGSVTTSPLPLALALGGLAFVLPWGAALVLDWQTRHAIVRRLRAEAKEAEAQGELAWQEILLDDEDTEEPAPSEPPPEPAAPTFERPLFVTGNVRGKSTAPASPPVNPVPVNRAHRNSEDEPQLTLLLTIMRLSFANGRKLSQAVLLPLLKHDREAYDWALHHKTGVLPVMGLIKDRTPGSEGEWIALADAAEAERAIRYCWARATNQEPPEWVAEELAQEAQIKPIPTHSYKANDNPYVTTGARVAPHGLAPGSQG